MMEMGHGSPPVNAGAPPPPPPPLRHRRHSTAGAPPLDIELRLEAPRELSMLVCRPRSHTRRRRCHPKGWPGWRCWHRPRHRRRAVSTPARCHPRRPRRPPGRARTRRATARAAGPAASTVGPAPAPPAARDAHRPRASRGRLADGTADLAGLLVGLPLAGAAAAPPPPIAAADAMLPVLMLVLRLMLMLLLPPPPQWAVTAAAQAAPMAAPRSAR